MKNYRQFLEFVSENYRTFIFTATFYSLWLTNKNANAFDPELFSFSGRMIGQATLNAYDINKRINIFYSSGLIFFLSLVFFSVISWRIVSFSRQVLKSSEFQIINYTSIAGITFYLFNLWTQNFSSSFELIYCIHKVAIAGFIIKYLFFKDKTLAQPINTSFYSIAYVIAISIFFILSEIAVLTHIFHKPDFLIVLSVTVILMIIIAAMVIKDKDHVTGRSLLNRFAFLAIPFAFVPVMSFFKDEIYLILNRHAVYYFTPAMLYLVFILFLSYLLFARYKKFKSRNREIKKSNEQLLALHYFPMLVVGLSTFTFYNPFAELSNEMFEAGNIFLPLMEFHKFGVIPILEKFNSHVLSELFFSGIYTFFNGLHGRELFIYDFILLVFWGIIVYRFLLKFSQNAYIALFAVFFFPLIDLLFFTNTAIGLLALFATHKVISQPGSFRNYFLLTCCLAFLLIWRIDIGYPCLAAACITILVYQINSQQFKISWTLCFKAITLLLVIGITLLLIISWYRQINAFEKLAGALNYLSSAQSYGSMSIGNDVMSVYKIQYFVFPLAMLMLAAAMLVFFKKYNVSGSQRFIYSSLFFLIIYYFVNFQRGLVRHGLIEGDDIRLSPYAFFIFSGSVFLFWRNKPKVAQLIAFIGISTFLLMNYKYPAPAEFKNRYSQTEEKIKHFGTIEPRPNIVRYRDTIHYEEKQYGDFKKLISDNLSDGQTFIDFSNEPMLYYYTDKISPSYFYQNPLSIQNDYLQNKFISDLSKYNAPFIVFSQFPEHWWDNVDDVPNTIRHYRLAEFFYQRYKPFTIIDNLCIWKRNDFTIKNEPQQIFSYIQDRDSTSAVSAVNYPVKLKENKKYLLRVNFKYELPTVHFRSENMDKPVTPDFTNMSTHAAYYLINGITGNFSIEFLKDNNTQCALLTENDLIPDFYSDAPHDDNLLELPHIWATYDKDIKGEKTLLNLASTPVLLKENVEQQYNFNPLIDKTTGNTVLITLEITNKTPLFLELLFGNGEKNYKGMFQFKLPAGAGTRNFAIRVSTQYNWYDSTISHITLVSKSDKNIMLKGLKILKAQ